MENINKKITELVANNPEAASVLHFLGIHYFNYTEQTLGEVCLQHGVEVELVVRRLHEHAQMKSQAQVNLEAYPVELIIEYLKHSHYVFIKQRLTYISSLLDHYQDSSVIVKDLKLIFPHFFKEFVEHVYDEEDTLFAYILFLRKLQQSKHHPIDAQALTGIQQKVKGKTIVNFAEEHRQEDHEMNGLRELTNLYQHTNSGDLHARVILNALKSFEGELKIHAKIENEILFPRALKLEQEVLTLTHS